MYDTLFSELEVGGLTLKNRLIMAPTYLGYAGAGGTVSPMLLDHYRLMAKSGVAMVVVENCTIDFETGSGSRRTIRADTDDNLPGLGKLARAIKDEGALACLQLNHAGRFAHAAAEPVAPSAVAYLSVMGGTYESFFLPHIVEKSKQPGYMLDLAEGIKKAVTIPVVAAGRISDGAVAERAVAGGQADLIGLARVLWADPEWPQKVRAGREAEIIRCNPDCGDACMQMVMKGRPAFCVKWPPEKMKAWKAKFV